MNLFHLCSLSEANDPAYILQCIESKVRFILDADAKTGLHYLLDSPEKDHRRINAILQHSESLLDPKTMDSISAQFT